MKGKGINLRYKLFFLFFVIVSLFIIAQVHSQDKFRLKPGARGEVCLNCHVTFQEKLKSPFIHTPVKTGDCSGCHNPHASPHGKLLAEDTDKVCYKCHKEVIPENAQSAHRVVVEGGCVKCHEPHTANNEFNLIRTGNELCFDCHKDIGDRILKAKFKHNPVEKGCTTCHNPHASSKARYLLKNDQPILCTECHKTDRPAFVKQHMNYPVKNARCSTCHDPHGSDKAVMLFDNVHKPVVNRMCNQCHEEPTSPNPFKAKKSIYEVCRGCHNEMYNETLNKNRVHGPLLSKVGCLTCHNPHASIEKALLKDPMFDLCGECHSDTIERQKKSLTKHKPVEEGGCTICHSPHASDNIYLLSRPSIVELCGSCHEWQKHSTHPIGEKVIDPRNKNLRVDCLSCHRAHGTEHKYMLYFPTISEMCTQCHIELKR